MAEVIEHEGVVIANEDGHFVVKFLQQSACASCKAKGFCASNENKEKLVDVWLTNGHNAADNIGIGDKVTVCATISMGWKAITFAFIIPLAVLVATVIVALLITGDEPLSAIIGLGALCPYYFVLYLLRAKMQKQISFWIGAKL